MKFYFEYLGVFLFGFLTGLHKELLNLPFEETINRIQHFSYTIGTITALFKVNMLWKEKNFSEV